MVEERRHLEVLRRNSTHSGVKSANTRSRRAVRTAPSISCSLDVPAW